jgi:hypothetical protein
MSSHLSEQINEIRASIPDKVRLIAVSKKVPVDIMRLAYAAGIRDFGESRIQEASDKMAQMQELTDINWHLIGHLQTNKAKKAIELFQWIHSVDSLKLAERLNHLAQEHSICPPICLQVKILPDPDKSGWHVSELLADLPRLNQYPCLNIQGLMTIPPFGLDDSAILDVFNRTHDLAQTIQRQAWPNIQMNQLSMGMSGDYQLAVNAGATMVRLGTILFGNRIE